MVAFERNRWKNEVVPRGKQGNGVDEGFGGGLCSYLQEDQELFATKTKVSLALLGFALKGLPGLTGSGDGFSQLLHAAYNFYIARASFRSRSL